MSSSSCAESGAAVLGGKGASLAVLTRAGLPVPPWFCLTTVVFEGLLPELGPLLDALAAVSLQDREQLRVLSAKLRARVVELGISPADRATLEDHFVRELGRDARVAVRSSLVGEDSATDSFAGQMDTYLFVELPQLVEHVLQCLASAFAERAIVYRRLRGHDLGGIRAAVVVQKMIDSDVSGVMFTRSPTPAHTHAVVVAGYGLGEGIVGGLVETDTFYLDPEGASVREEIAEKLTRIVSDPVRGTGTRLDSVAAADASRPTLGPEQLRELNQLGLQLEKLQHGPQDIEFAYAAGALHLLQCRPITTVAAGRETVFDNSNVVESYPGLSLPLTFSFARRAYEVIFRAGAVAWGVPPETIASYAKIHGNLIGLVRGRIYYNILNWYALYQQFPGFEFTLPAWEKALGLDARHAVRPTPATVLERVRRVPSMIALAGRILSYYFSIDRRSEQFLAETRETLRVATDLDVEAMDAHALLDELESLQRRVFTGYAISPMNDTFGQQLHELLGRYLRRAGVEDAEALRNQLLCAEPGMDSVEPVRSILALTDLVRADKRLREHFESSCSTEVLAKELASEPRHQVFQAALAEHLERYGDRTLQELKLETPTGRDDPRFALTMIRTYLRGGQHMAKLDGNDAAVRRAAEERLRKQLRFRPARRLVSGYLLRRLRASLRYRENLRLARTRYLGFFKRVYRALGTCLTGARLLDAPEDVFWLTDEEVAGAVRGHAVTLDLRALVALRRREYAQYELEESAPRIVARGVVLGSAAARVSAARTSARGMVLRGQGAAGGVVTAIAKVVHDPGAELELSGEILVAPMTDPGWVFLMVASSGLVAEKGSLLSHTAIIGRELGIPTVVGVKDVTKLLRSGQRIEIDGGAGTVRVLDEDPTGEEPPQSAR